MIVAICDDDDDNGGCCGRKCGWSRGVQVNVLTTLWGRD